MQEQIDCRGKTPNQVLSQLKYEETADDLEFFFGEKSVYPLWLVPFLVAMEMKKAITIHAKEVCDYVRKIGETQGWTIIDGNH